MTTPTMLAWPGDLPRMYHVHEAMAACVEHAGSRARHVRPSRREIRQAERAAKAQGDREWARLVKAVSA